MNGPGQGSPSFFRGARRGVGAPLLQQPIPPSGALYPGGRGGSMLSNRGRDNFIPPANRTFQLIPMPSKAEINQSRGGGNFGGRGRGGRGFGRGQARGNQHNQGFDQDTYDFDEYYQDPQAALSREHLSEFEKQQLSTGPPEKKAKFQPSATFQPQPLMGIDFDSDVIEDQPLAQQQQPATQSYDQFSNQQLFSATVNPGYFTSDQIAGSSTNHSNFERSTTASASVGVAAYPVNYYEGVEDYNFNAVPFDYNNIRRGRGGGAAGKGIGRGGGNQKQAGFSRGGNNSRGKSGGKGRPRPGLGSKGKGGKANAGNNVGASTSTSNGGPSLSGGNQMPLGGAGPSNQSFQPAPAKNYNLFGRKKKSIQQIKEENNQEYTEWLQQKSWLHTPILGIVKPASK